MTVPDNQRHLGGDDVVIEDSALLLDETIHVRQDGPHEAPVLVLVHGFATSSRSWDPLVPLLIASHRVIRVDLLGHGRSAKPSGPGYEIPEHAHRLGLVLDRLGVERAIGLGHSTGGAVTTSLAEQRPDLVSALALIDTGPRLEAFIAPELSVEPSQWPLTDEQTRQAMDAAFSRPGYQIPQQLVDDVRGMTLHAFTATLRASSDYLRERPLPDRLAAVGKPLLVIFGEDDRRWRSSSAADYRVVPGARIELLPGLGHSPMLEDPPRVAAPVLDFTTHVGLAGGTGQPTHGGGDG